MSHFLNIRSYFLINSQHSQCFCAEPKSTFTAQCDDSLVILCLWKHMPSFLWHVRRSRVQNVLPFHVAFFAICHYLPHANCFHTCVWSSYMREPGYFYLQVSCHEYQMMYLMGPWPELARGYWGCLNQNSDSCPGSETPCDDKQQIRWIITGTSQATKAYFWASSQNTMQTDWYPWSASRWLDVIVTCLPHSFFCPHTFVWGWL